MKMCGWTPAELVQVANKFATDVLGEPICKPLGFYDWRRDPLQASEVWGPDLRTQREDRLEAYEVPAFCMERPPASL